MPLDSTNYVETKADPTLDDLIAWLETRNPDETYVYHSISGRCLLGKFCLANGVTWETWHQFYNFHNNVAARQGWLGPVAAQGEYTMGAALERARAWRTEHAV